MYMYVYFVSHIMFFQFLDKLNYANLMAFTTAMSVIWTMKDLFLLEFYSIGISGSTEYVSGAVSFWIALRCHLF